MQWFDILSQSKKGTPYSITERRVSELIPVLCSQPAGDVSHKPGCHYFPPGMLLPPQPLRGLPPISLLGEQRHDGCELRTICLRLLPDGCDLNPGLSVPESSMLTNRLPCRLPPCKRSHGHPAGRRLRRPAVSSRSVLRRPRSAAAARRSSHLLIPTVRDRRHSLKLTCRRVAR